MTTVTTGRITLKVHSIALRRWEIQSTTVAVIRVLSAVALIGLLP